MFQEKKPVNSLNRGVIMHSQTVLTDPLNGTVTTLHCEIFAFRIRQNIAVYAASADPYSSEFRPE